MKIYFPKADPVVTPSGAIAFSAQVKSTGRIITVEITEVALRAHFGAKSRNPHDLISAFIGGTRRIHRVARRKILLTATGCYLLVAADF